MKKIMQAILAAVGIGAIYKGWESLQSDMPKPTEEREITRIDYLTGEYQEELEQREHELERSHKQGKWYLAAGAAFLAGGMTLLAEAIIERKASDAQSSRDQTSKPKNGAKEHATGKDHVTGST